MIKTTAIIKHLKSLANPAILNQKENQYGIVTKNGLGIKMKELKEYAATIGYNKELALALYDENIYEAKLMCAILLKPIDVTLPLANKWISDFDNWEICDTFCMHLIAKSKIALQVIEKFITHKNEYQKRAAFAIMAAYCNSNKNATNNIYEKFLLAIITNANDDRNFVKKAVNWALRSIGKRNVDLHKLALKAAYKILENPSKAAQWIAKDAINELESDSVNIVDYPRSIYRPI